MFIKKLDLLGRIVIPKEMRERLDIELGDALDLSLNDNAIIINKHYENTLDELRCAIQKVEDPQLRCELWNVFDNYKKRCD